MVTRMMLPRQLLSSDNCSPTTLAPQIVEGVGTSPSEDEGVDGDVDVRVGEDDTVIELWF